MRCEWHISGTLVEMTRLPRTNLVRGLHMTFASYLRQHAKGNAKEAHIQAASFQNPLGPNCLSAPGALEMTLGETWMIPSSPAEITVTNNSTFIEDLGVQPKAATAANLAAAQAPAAGHFVLPPAAVLYGPGAIAAQATSIAPGYFIPPAPVTPGGGLTKFGVPSLCKRSEQRFLDTELRNN
jgi:hypothetical protein